MTAATDEDKYLKIAYFASIAGVSILAGFSVTLSRLRKEPAGAASLHEEGVALARRALARATLYSVGGFGLFALVSYELFGRELIARKAREYREARARDSGLPVEIEGLFRSDKQLVVPGGENSK